MEFTLGKSSAMAARSIGGSSRRLGMAQAKATLDGVASESDSQQGFSHYVKTDRKLDKQREREKENDKETDRKTDRQKDR